MDAVDRIKVDMSLQDPRVARGHRPWLAEVHRQ
jgi:hypothetical protein